MSSATSACPRAQRAAAVVDLPRPENPMNKTAAPPTQTALACSGNSPRWCSSIAIAGPRTKNRTSLGSDPDARSSVICRPPEIWYVPTPTYDNVAEPGRAQKARPGSASVGAPTGSTRPSARLTSTDAAGSAGVNSGNGKGEPMVSPYAIDLCMGGESKLTTTRGKAWGKFILPHAHCPQEVIAD